LRWAVTGAAASVPVRCLVGEALAPGGRGYGRPEFLQSDSGLEGEGTQGRLLVPGFALAPCLVEKPPVFPHRVVEGTLVGRVVGCHGLVLSREAVREISGRIGETGKMGAG
jgi:hypothetical protein